MTSLYEGLKAIGRRAVPTIGDGNCFYRSLAVLETGSADHHSSLRRALVMHAPSMPAALWDNHTGEDLELLRRRWAVNAAKLGELQLQCKAFSQ
jgi:hypothetical protein